MSGRSEHRTQVPIEVIKAACQHTVIMLWERLEEKGKGSFASRHEILGILEEEVYETTKAVHEETLDSLRRELLDVAVTGIFGVACIDAGTLDW